MEKIATATVDKNEGYINTCNGNTILIPGPVQTTLHEKQQRKKMKRKNEKGKKKKKPKGRS